jgi:hypothetical protein
MSGTTDGLMMGCDGGVYLISGSDSGGLKPGGIRQVMASNYGCENIPPISFGNQLFYVEKGGKRIRVINLGGNGESFELSRLFFDSINSPIVSWAFAYNPFPIICAAKANGDMICVLVEKQDNIVAGFNVSLGGSGDVKSVTKVRDANGNDKIYFLVSRTINGSTKQYLEYLADSPYVDTSMTLAQSICSDCSITVTNAPASTSVTGLSHLEGKAVDVLADGVVVTGKTVSSGAITLSTAASSIIVGLAYRPAFETPNLETPAGSQGFSLGNRKRVNQCDVGFYRSLGAKIGRDSSNMNEIDFGTYTVSNVGFFSGVKKVPFNGDHTEQARVRIEQVAPTPMCITFLSPEVGDYD